MAETADRYRKVAADFTERVASVPDGSWDRATPCDDWAARDIVAHLDETARRFLGRVDVEIPQGPSVQDDPMGAWIVVRDAVQAALEDPATAARTYESPMGTSTLEQGIGLFGVGDVLVHTWDLARAVGLDERLDADEVHRLYEAMEPNDAMMRQGTAFGPRVAVDPGVDEQTQLLAFTGRQV